MTRRGSMNTTKPDLSASHRQAGASMIEVLVAILLVSVGLLGIAGLSGATFSYNKVSQMRLTGIALVNDLADRARVNVYGYDLGEYDIALSRHYGGSLTAPEFNPPDPSDPTYNSNAARTLAEADVDQFLRNVRNRLPQGDAIVMGAGAGRASATSRDLDVWLLWQEPTTDAGDTLFGAGQGNCPNSLTPDEQALYSCMYFKVGL